MNHRTRPDFGRDFRDPARPFGLERCEFLLTPLKQNADQIDQRIGAECGASHRVHIAQIGLDGVDLSDPAHGLQIAGQIRPAHRDPHAAAGLGERPDHVAADKARAAVNRD